MTTLEGGPMNCPVLDSYLVSGPMFSADGKSIYFASGRSGQSQVWRSGVDGSLPVQVTKQGGGWVLKVRATTGCVPGRLPT